MDETLTEGLRRLREGDPDFERLTDGRLEEVSVLLNRYIEEIELFNPAYGLAAVSGRRELVVKHILDSLAPLSVICRLPGMNGAAPPAQTAARPRIADVGSGAGLPGIPLAIVLSGGDFTLIERTGRRAGFLRNVQAVLGLANVWVEEEEMRRALPGRFDLAAFRAFRPLERDTLKSLFRLLRPGGVLAAYKGRREKIEAEMAAAEPSTGGWEILPVRVPFLEEERHLALIRPPV
ncbi:MAG: 16S rRNA (guanine(527)-N(7))-methyltransferase RsmG [Treponema sp.]|jgi:16S rRNA (guanine527-N7)-methyltransferase|nr:16S rRNA (guanine(527)-N(7))-methyltransferase RsmG [Treponema sp.]